MTHLSPMFINYNVRIGEAELAGRTIALHLSPTRIYGPLAAPIARAGRKITGHVNLCIDCGHRDYDPEEYEVDCNTPRCPKAQPPAITLHTIANPRSR